MKLPSHRAKETVLVVGGAGYVGSIAVAALLDQGYRVVVLDALFYGSDGLRSAIGRPNFKLVTGDTRDTATLSRLLPRVDAVIHLGEIVGDPACDLDPIVTRSVNRSATARLAALAAEHGVRRFVYASSCSVYGATTEVAFEDSRLNPVSLYGLLKREAEEAVLEPASDTFHPTIFRLATVYGLSPRPRFDLVVNTLAARAVTDGSVVIQGGGQWRPFVHVADVAELLVHSLKVPSERIAGQVFNVGSNDQNHTIADVGEIVREQLPGITVIATDREDHRNYRASFDKVRDTFNFRPKRSVQGGVAEIIAAVQRGELRDPFAATHSNVRALVETEGRRRLWREDLEGDPAHPFRPRDAETSYRARQPMQSAKA